MKISVFFLTLFLVHSAFSSDQVVDKACVTKLASKPYCMNILSAESNCKKGPEEAKAIADCVDNYLVKLRAFPSSPQKDQIINVGCLIDEVTDTSSPKNKSLCN